MLLTGNKQIDEKFINLLASSVDTLPVKIIFSDLDLSFNFSSSFRTPCPAITRKIFLSLFFKILKASIKKLTPCHSLIEPTNKQTFEENTFCEILFGGLMLSK